MKLKVENGIDFIVEYFCKGFVVSYFLLDDFCVDYFISVCYLYLSGVVVVFFESFYVLLEYVVKVMKVEGKIFFFDFNLCLVLWKSEVEMVEKFNCFVFQVDWVLSGLKEGVIFIGQQILEGIVDFYFFCGVKVVVIKIGCDGVWFKSVSGEQGMVDVIKVDNVVDIVGVGDGFVVGVISVLLEGKILFQVVNCGNKIGLLVIQVQGDSEGLFICDVLGE